MVNLTKKSQPRAKHDIIGSSDDGNDVYEQSRGEDTENEGDSEAGEANNKIVVPDTDEGLRDQFNQFFVEFTRPWTWTNCTIEWDVRAWIYCTIGV